MNSKWDIRFMRLAELVSTWSKDPSTQIGAVIVDDKNIVVGLGYNGFPRGVADSTERLANRELKYKLVTHAEVNAVLNAGHRAKGCRIYVYPTLMLPNICPDCAKVVAQAGIVEIVGYDGQTEPRWQQHAEASRIILDEAGVRRRVIPAEYQ